MTLCAPSFSCAPQHGPHLPLGVDAYIATGVAERVAQRVGALVAPTINYGYKSVPCMVRSLAAAFLDPRRGSRS